MKNVDVNNQIINRPQTISTNPIKVCIVRVLRLRCVFKARATVEIGSDPIPLINAVYILHIICAHTIDFQKLMMLLKLVVGSGVDRIAYKKETHDIQCDEVRSAISEYSD